MPSDRSSGSDPKARGESLSEAATVYAPALPGADAPARPKEPRSRASRLVLLAGTGLVCVVGIVVAAIALRSQSTLDALEESGPVVSVADAGAIDAAIDVTTAPIVSAKPAPYVLADALDEAKAKGITALVSLSEQNPNDPAVLRALIVAYARDKTNYGKALSATRRYLALTKDKPLDPDVERVVIQVANGPVDVATSALELMAKSMGSRGPDLLYELLLAPGVGKFPKDRAAKLLKSPDVAKIATPAVLIANDLRAAKGCSRRPLFARAAKDGDERALAQLKPLLATKGCAWHRQADCFTCLGNRADLRATIDTITKRLEAARASGGAQTGSP